MSELFDLLLPTELVFSELAEAPDWLPTLVQWHQQQWPHQSEHQRRQKLQQHIEPGPFPTTLLALQGEQLVGSVSVVCYQRLGGLGPSYWVANAYVAPDCRRRGLGSQLIQAAQAYAQRQNLNELYLYATDQVSFYRRLGWQSLRQKSFKGELATIMRRQWNSSEKGSGFCDS